MCFASDSSDDEADGSTCEIRRIPTVSHTIGIHDSHIPDSMPGIHDSHIPDSMPGIYDSHIPDNMPVVTFGERIDVDDSAEEERVLSKEHPDTLSTRGNLASSCSEQGKNAEAKALESTDSQTEATADPDDDSEKRITIRGKTGADILRQLQDKNGDNEVPILDTNRSPTGTAADIDAVLADLPAELQQRTTHQPGAASSNRSVEHVCAWLTNVLKLAPEVVDHFHCIDIDGDALLALEDADLEHGLGVTHRGDRARIIAWRHAFFDPHDLATITMCQHVSVPKHEKGSPKKRPKDSDGACLQVALQGQLAGLDTSAHTATRVQRTSHFSSAFCITDSDSDSADANAAMIYPRAVMTQGALLPPLAPMDLHARVWAPDLRGPRERNTVMARGARMSAFHPAEPGANVPLSCPVAMILSQDQQSSAARMCVEGSGKCAAVRGDHSTATGHTTGRDDNELAGLDTSAHTATRVQRTSHFSSAFCTTPHPAGGSTAHTGNATDSMVAAVDAIGGSPAALHPTVATDDAVGGSPTALQRVQLYHQKERDQRRQRHVKLGKKRYLSFEKALYKARSFKPRNQTAWQVWCMLPGRLPAYIPSNPDVVYAQVGWRGWDHWLGTETRTDPERRSPNVTEPATYTEVRADKAIMLLAVQQDCEGALVSPRVLLPCRGVTCCPGSTVTPYVSIHMRTHTCNTFTQTGVRV